LISAEVMSAARTGGIALPAKMVTAMATANAALMNVRLVVLIVPYHHPALGFGHLLDFRAECRSPSAK
jgi:hypothetical protein